MISELAVVAATARTNATLAHGLSFWEAVAAAWWAIVFLGVIYYFPRFRRVPVEKRPFTWWLLPAMVISGIWAAFHVIISLSRL